MATERSELLREGSTLRSKLVAEKQHAAVLQVKALLAVQLQLLHPRAGLCGSCFDHQGFVGRVSIIKALWVVFRSSRLCGSCFDHQGFVGRVSIIKACCTSVLESTSNVRQCI